jgi:uncharacterized protein YlxW (UPF0749 family)
MPRLHPILPAALCAAIALTTLPGVAAPKRKPSRSDFEEMQRRLSRAEMLAGLTAIEGPGLAVTLRDSPRKPPKGASKESLRITDQDVNAVLDALRAAGAEALAVGGADGEPERVLAGTAARAQGQRLQVNGAALTPPYRILAVGDVTALRGELYRPDGIVKRAALDTLDMIRVEEVSELRIPGARRVEDFRYARPVLADAPDSEEPKRRGEDDKRTERREEARENAAVPAPAKRTVKPASNTPAAQTEEPAARAGVFGGRDLQRYHFAGCRFGERLAKAERIAFRTVADAQRVGRTPCPVCASGGQ